MPLRSGNQHSIQPSPPDQDPQVELALTLFKSREAEASSVGMMTVPVDQLSSRAQKDMPLSDVQVTTANESPVK